jgi:hypothetical protein
MAMTPAYWNIGMVLVGTMAAAFCFALGIMKQLSNTASRDRVLASYAFGVACLLLAVTGLIAVGPWLTFLAAFFMIIGAWRLQQEREAKARS